MHWPRAICRCSSAGRSGRQHSFPWGCRAWQAAPRRLSIKAASGAAPERTGVFRQLGLDE